MAKKVGSELMIVPLCVAVAALIGVGMLTNSGGDPTWGDALCIGSAVLFGVHKWRSESVTALIPQTTELVAVQLAVLAVASAVFTLPELWGDFEVRKELDTTSPLINIERVFVQPLCKPKPGTTTKHVTEGLPDVIACCI